MTQPWGGQGYSRATLSWPLLLLLSLSTACKEDWHIAKDRQIGQSVFDWDTTRLSRMTSASTARRLPTDEAKAKSCQQSYETFFKAPVLNIHFAFGYKDTRPARFVGDFYERVAMVQHLTAPCPPNYYSCGFQRAEDDQDLLFKEMPGLDGRMREIRIRITHSSIGPDDSSNRELKALQKWQSHLSYDNFTEGLRNGDVIFYVGHSRDGGGPDFGPPKLVLEGGHVDYTYYATARPGLGLLLKALKERKQKKAGPLMIGLFSCISDKHFSEDIEKVSPESSLVTSSVLLYYSDALASSLGTLNALLGMWCEDDFLKALKPEGSTIGSSLQGMFRKNELIKLVPVAETPAPAKKKPKPPKKKRHRAEVRPGARPEVRPEASDD